MVELAAASAVSIMRPRPLFAKTGDSRVSTEILSNSPSFGRQMQSGSSWLEFCTHGRVRAPVTHNKGVGGTKPSDLLGQIDQVAALSPKPSHCWILSGTNAINNATTVTGLMDGMKTDFLAAWARCLSYNMIPVTCLDCPRQWTDTTLTAAVKRRVHNELNQWLWQNAEANGSILIDDNWELTDPANANGECLTSLYLVESPAIHPALGGGLKLGTKFTNVMAALGLPPRYVGIGLVDFYDATNNPRGNLLAEGGCFFTAGGQKTGTNPPTGNVPNGMILRNDDTANAANLTSCVGSLVARTDGPGNIFKVVATASGTCRILVYGTGTTYNCAVGDVVEYATDFKMEAATGLAQVSVALEDRLTGGGSVNGAQYGFQHGTVATVGPVPSDFDGRAICPQLTLSPSFGNLRFSHIIQFGASGGSATFYLGAAELRKVVA